MREAEWAFSIFWMYSVLLDKRRYGMNSRDLLRVLAEYEIQTRPLWQPVHLSQAHQDGGVVLSCPIAERLNRDAISLPCSVGMTEKDLSSVGRAVSQIGGV